MMLLGLGIADFRKWLVPNADSLGPGVNGRNY